MCAGPSLEQLYMDRSERGFGVHNLCTTKGITHLNALVQCLGETDSITGQLMRASIELAKIEIGLGGNIFDHNYEDYSPLLSDTWIKGLWKFVDEKEIQ